MSILTNGRLILTSLPVASAEKVAHINMVRQEKETEVIDLGLSSLYPGFWGFLMKPLAGLGSQSEDIPQKNKEKK